MTFNASNTQTLPNKSQPETMLLCYVIVYLKDFGNLCISNRLFEKSIYFSLRPEKEKM